MKKHDQQINKTTHSVSSRVNRSPGTGSNSVHLQDNRASTVLQKKANNTGLPDNLKSGIEILSGHSMDDVKVHYNSSKPAQLQAHAYAQGTNIHLAPGQEKHLPHEAWHVVQQKQGRVRPTVQMKGKVNINDDAGLEKEADTMGAKSMQLKVNKVLHGLKSSTLKTIGSDVAQLGKVKAFGDSAKLARARWKRKTLLGGKSFYKFKDWKRGREAQHLIPAQICQEFGISKVWANSSENGMMLPSGRTDTNHLRISSLDKGKMHHIKFGGAHPNYNKTVRNMAYGAGWKKGMVNYKQFLAMTNKLRKLNRPKKSGPAKGYVDNIKP